AFSDVDGRFGFQVGPRLTAMGNPSKKRSTAAQTLERQAFPALLIVRLGDGDMTARLQSIIPSEGTDARDGSKSNSDSDLLILKEPALQFTQIRRWAPLKHSYARDFEWSSPQHWTHPELTERRRLQAADELTKARISAYEYFDPTNMIGQITPRGVKEGIRKRIENLESQLIGGAGRILLSTSLLVPQKKQPNVSLAISGVSPA